MSGVFPFERLDFFESVQAQNNYAVSNFDWATYGQSISENLVGQTIASKNTIALGASASSVNDYYLGFDVVVTRIDTEGRKKQQRKEIIAYDGSAKVATIDGIWDSEFLPTVGDTYEIVPTYADRRMSINTAIQTLDYITSDRYGRGLDPQEDLNLDSWLESARECAKQSDVSVKVLSNPTVFPGAVYSLMSGPKVIFRGELVGIQENKYITFTKVRGKLTNLWMDWKSYTVGQIVYHKNNLYLVTSAGTKTSPPVHTSGDVNGLQYTASLTLSKTSGNGPNVLTLDISGGNPVIGWKDGREVPGYSLYDCDSIDYWRYLGWDEHSQRNATRHQTNIIIDTSLPLFDNINTLLQHCGGILRYSGGKYYLDIEKEAKPEEIVEINDDHIIGKIEVSDEGTRSSYNSLTASFSDPANKYEPINISFFNSNYLKEDKNVPKKGNLTISGITNYYNARMLADKFLARSRFGTTIAMTLTPDMIKLLAGRVVAVTYGRFGWTSKKFRIESLTINEDCTINITAKEYDESFYYISNLSAQKAKGQAGNAKNTAIAAPGQLIATNIESSNERVDSIELSWTNNFTGAISPNIFTEILVSNTKQYTLNIVSVSSNMITVNDVHTLKIGDQVTLTNSVSSLQPGVYYVSDIPGFYNLRLSSVRFGSSINLSDDLSPSCDIITANVAATVPYPTNTFIDVANSDERITKYYWIRHKVIK